MTEFEAGNVYFLPGGSEYRPTHNSPFIVIPDLVDRETGKTYREENAKLEHSIPIGTLVDVLQDDPLDDAPYAGVRLYVVYHGRDCDMTPLYWLSPCRDDTEREYGSLANPRWVGGFPENILKVVRLPE